jgi:hypothetical protein
MFITMFEINLPNILPNILPNTLPNTLPNSFPNSLSNILSNVWYKPKLLWRRSWCMLIPATRLLTILISYVFTVKCRTVGIYQICIFQNIMQIVIVSNGFKLFQIVCVEKLCNYTVIISR